MNALKAFNVSGGSVINTSKDFNHSSGNGFLKSNLIASALSMPSSLKILLSKSIDLSSISKIKTLLGSLVKATAKPVKSSSAPITRISLSLKSSLESKNKTLDTVVSGVTLPWSYS